MTEIEKLQEAIALAEAVVVGGASGMSAASGFVFYYMDDAVYKEIAGTIREKYGIYSMFDALYDRRLTRGEYWAVLLRTMKYIYQSPTGETYSDLAQVLRGKNFYVATTNQDAQFFRVFPEEKITRIQGDWRYFQCDARCHDGIYYNEEQVFELCQHIENDTLPEELVPRCERCGSDMSPWIRSRTFLQGKFYNEEMKRYHRFIQENAHRKILFLELGVGLMTPMFIKEPFMNMVYQLKDATYATINPKHAIIPKEIAEKSIGISEDISLVLRQLLGKSTDDIDREKNTQFNPSRVY